MTPTHFVAYYDPKHQHIGQVNILKISPLAVNDKTHLDSVILKLEALCSQGGFSVP